MIWRIGATVILIVTAILGSVAIDDFNRVRAFADLRPATSDISAFTRIWVNNITRQPRRLALDPTIVASLSGSEMFDTNNLTRTLYEFSYTDKLENLYIYSPQLEEEIIYPATARAPTGHLREAFAEAFNTEEPHTLRYLKLGGEDYLFVSALIQNLETEEPLGLAAYIEPASKLIARHKRTSLNNLPGAQALLMDLRSPNGPHVFLDIFGLNYPKAASIPVRFISQFDALSSRFFSLDTDRIIATKNLPTERGWRVGLSVTRANLSEQTSIYKYILFAFCIVIGLLFWLRPILQGLQKLMPEKKKRTPKSTEQPGIDHPNLQSVSEREEALKAAMEQFNTGSFGKKQNTAPRMDKGKTPERELADTIIESLDQNRTKLLFQAVYDIRTHQPIMYEVFLRILDEAGDLITPDKFVPIAHRYKLHPLIDAHVITRVAQEYLALNNPNQLPLAVNLGGDTFESIAFLQSLIAAIDPKWSSKLILELRSQAIIQDPRAMEFIRTCRNLGARFSIDYFGGGPSMLVNASRMKFSFVKADSLSFQTVEQKKELIRLAQAAIEEGLPFVLERVESTDMIKLCEKAGIPLVQGYLTGKPEETQNTKPFSLEDMPAPQQPATIEPAIEDSVETPETSDEEPPTEEDTPTEQVDEVTENADEDDQRPAS